MSQSATQWVFVGTYTHSHGENRDEGIYVYEFDPQTGALERRHAVPTEKNPSFLVLSPDKRFLYAVNEVGEWNGTQGGAVSAYAVDPATGALTFLNAQSTRGADPCYISLDKSGKWAFVANYSGGSVAAFPLNTDGSLGAAASFVQHEGHAAVDPERQDAPHAHSILLDPAETWALVADLGKDALLGYRFDSASGALAHDRAAGGSAAPGAGPRHIGFHPNGKYFYVINELNGTVACYAFDAASGALTTISTVSLFADGAYDGSSMGADLHIAASGRFLYTSNRGSDSISVFAIDESSGALSLVEVVSSGGQKPRNFGFDATGNFLLVANQDSANIVVFGVDSETGRLTPTGQVASVPMPVCVQAVAKS